MKNLSGKVALITGGTRGIGKSLVEAFATNGCHVAFTYRSSKSSADEIIASLSATGTKVMAYQSDASSFSQAEELVNTVVAEFERIDILINNAGITRDTLLMRMTEEQWDEVIDNNLKSAFNLSKFAIKPMMKQRSGSIINMGSVVGIFGNAGQANYAASKAGLVGFTKSLAKELGSRNIRANVVAPGFIKTDMTDELSDKVMDEYLKNIPLGRLGETEDIAEACLFLGSDSSQYITGQVFSVCGGLNV